MSGKMFSAPKKLVRAIISPYLYEILRCTLAHKRIPELLRPVTFNDKLSNRKFFQKNPWFPIVSDKALARRFVEERVGGAILTKLYFCGGDVAAINFDTLPESFVVKSTHGSGMDFILFVENKYEVEEEALRDKARELLRKDYGVLTNEWWYLEIKRQVLVEERLKDDEYGFPLDYKFFVFHGEVKFVQVDYARFQKHTRTFYDKEWRPQEFTIKYRMGAVTPKPKPFTKMVEVAESLGKEFDFVRIDLYCINDERIVFGEITPSPGAGLARFQPTKWDYIFGMMW